MAVVVVGDDLRIADFFNNRLTADCVLVLGASLARVDQALRQQAGSTQGQGQEEQRNAAERQTLKAPPPRLHVRLRMGARVRVPPPPPMTLQHLQGLTWLYGHACILSINSIYLRSFIMGSLAEQQLSRQVHSVDKPGKAYQLLVLPLEEDERSTEAAQAVIKCCYSHCLPDVADTPLQLVLQMLLQADFLQAGKVTQLCMWLAELVSMWEQPGEQLDYAALCSILSLPESLLGERAGGDQACRTKMLEVCSRHLVQLLGNVNRVLTSPELIYQFRQLSSAAIKAYLQCEGLVIDCENLWMRGPQGRSCSPDTAAELCGQIRVKCLDRTFLIKGLPLLPWSRLTEEQRSELNMFATSPAPVQEELRHINKYPPRGLAAAATAAWCKGNRTGLSRVTQVLDLRVTRAELEAAIQEVKQTGRSVVLTSPEQFLDGYRLEVVLFLYPQATADKIWVGLRLHGRQQLFAGSALAVDSPLLGLELCTIKEAVVTYQQPGHVPTPLTQGGWGWPSDSFGTHPTEPLDIKSYNPLLNEGQLSIRATVMG